jgi:threonine dehydrogenase-like Zn-dependent dehydrogenase
MLTVRNKSNIVTISYYGHIMEAVVFNGPYNIGVEHKPIPTIRDPNDAIVKVEVAGICGSELHMYRGHQSTATGHIMVWSELELLRFASTEGHTLTAAKGHEFVGTVQEIGSAVNTHRIGDRVVSIFSVTW